MFNNGRFNVLGLNSGAVASLVIISAVADFGTGTASTDFSESNVERKARANLNGNVQALFSEGERIQKGDGAWSIKTGNHFKPWIIYKSKVNWSFGSNFSVKSEALFHNALNLTSGADFLAYTDFVEASLAPLSVGIDWTSAVANRGESISGAWTCEIDWLSTEADLWVDRRVTSEWVAEGSLWLNPHKDEGLGYINFDAYWFVDAEKNWNVTPFLVEIFTIGGFISLGAHSDFQATKVIFGLSALGPVENTLTINGLSQEHVSTVDISVNVVTDWTAVRIASSPLHEWFTRPSRFVAPAHIEHASKAAIKSVSTFKATGKTRFAAKSSLTLKSELAPIETTRTRLSKVRWWMSLNQEKEFDAIRTTYSEMSLDGIAGTLISAGVLRLVDAPASRYFEVPFPFEHYEVPYENNKFEVPS